MSQAPLESLTDTSSPQHDAFRQAVARRGELLREGMSNSGLERNCCYLNTGGGRFANISTNAGLDHIGDGRAYATVDWDHDGDLDLWATNRTAPRVQFLRNQATADNHFLAVKLVGNGSTTNRDAIGARVELVLKDSSGGKIIKTIRAGEGFLGQSSKSLHFGLGLAKAIDRLIVHWPGGEVEEITDLQADRHYTIAHGSGQAQLWSRPQGNVQLVAGTGETQPTEAATTRIQLRYRIPLPELPYETVAGEKTSLQPHIGAPTLVNLWASWCQPCLKELALFGKQQQVFRAKGLQLIALSVDQLAEDQASNPAVARAFLERQNFAFATGFASNDFVGKLETMFYYLFDFRRPWAVPTSLLIDRQGRLAVIYVGPVEIDTLIADVEQLSLDDPAWLEAALPFAGRWIDRQRHPNLTAMINTYLDRGFREDAYRFVDTFANVLVADPESSPLLTQLATSLRREGHVVKSKQRFEQALGADPQNATAHLEFGKLLVQTRQIKDALRHCREAVRLQRDNSEAHFFLANLLNSQGDRPAALSHFELTVEQTPNSSQARLALGNAYATQLQWDRASEQLRQAAQLDPENSSVHYQLARVLQKAGLTPEAIAHYRRALELKPDSGDLHYSLGAALAAAGQTKEAIGQLRQAHQLQPDSLLIMNGLAWVIATAEPTSAQDRAAALQVAEAAAKQTQYSHPQILDTLAAAYAATGEFDKAAQTAQRAIDRASAAKNDKLANEIRDRLRLYRAGKPFREAR